MLAMLWSLLATATGTLATYLYEEEGGDSSPGLGTRLAQGLALGFSALALVAYPVVAWLGYGALERLLITLVTVAPLPWLWRRPGLARAVRRDVSRVSGQWRSWVWILPVGLLLCLVFSRVLFFYNNGLCTGFDNNLGDLTFHLGIITGFSEGQNFPPQHPEYAGSRLTYPFMADFLVALVNHEGFLIDQAMLVENILLGLALLTILHRFAWLLTGNRLAAGLTPLLVWLSGGLGGFRAWTELRQSGRGLVEFMLHLPHDYTLMDGGYRWGNAVTVLFVPQRTLLLGLPLALTAWGLWWRALREENDRMMLAAGVIVGLLPLVHAHSYITSMLLAGMMAAPHFLVTLLRRLPRAAAALAEAAVGGALGAAIGFCMGHPGYPWWGLAVGLVVGALLGSQGLVVDVPSQVDGPLNPCPRRWLWFFVPALGVAGPQMLWATHGAATQAGSFLAVSLGWDHQDLNPLAFWLLNTGLLLPLWMAGLLVAAPQRPGLTRFHLPFAYMFVLANLLRLSPWLWDNIKFLFIWFLGSIPLVALLLARMPRALMVICVVLLTFSGGLDVWRVLTGCQHQQEYDPPAMAFAQQISQQTPPRSLIVAYPTYNSPIELTGRRLLMGYGGHLWSQGLNYAQREADLREIYSGSGRARELLGEYKVNYVVIGPQERSSWPVNESFFQSTYPIAVQSGEYKLFQISQ